MTGPDAQPPSRNRTSHRLVVMRERCSRGRRRRPDRGPASNQSDTGNSSEGPIIGVEHEGRTGRRPNSRLNVYAHVHLLPAGRDPSRSHAGKSTPIRDRLVKARLAPQGRRGRAFRSRSPARRCVAGGGRSNGFRRSLSTARPLARAAAGEGSRTANGAGICGFAAGRPLRSTMRRGWPRRGDSRSSPLRARRSAAALKSGRAEDQARADSRPGIRRSSCCTSVLSAYGPRAPSTNRKGTDMKGTLPSARRCFGRSAVSQRRGRRPFGPATARKARDPSDFRLTSESRRTYVRRTYGGP